MTADPDIDFRVSEFCCGENHRILCICNFFFRQRIDRTLMVGDSI